MIDGEKALSILKGISDQMRVNIDIGYSHEAPNTCVFLIKERALFDRISREVALLKNYHGGEFEAVLMEEKVAGLLACLEEEMKGLVLLTHAEHLHKDAVMLFNDPDIPDSLYKANQKLMEEL